VKQIVLKTPHPLRQVDVFEGSFRDARLSISPGRDPEEDLIFHVEINHPSFKKTFYAQKYSLADALETLRIQLHYLFKEKFSTEFYIIGEDQNLSSGYEQEKKYLVYVYDSIKASVQKEFSLSDAELKKESQALSNDEALKDYLSSNEEFSFEKS
jgi:uncharacterized protein YfeS